jgi:hypothetical protein
MQKLPGSIKTSLGGTILFGATYPAIGQHCNTWSKKQRKINRRESRWYLNITSIIINLYQQIWQGRNTFIHGTTVRELQKNDHAAIIAHVTDIQKEPKIGKSLPSYNPSAPGTPLPQIHWTLTPMDPSRGTSNEGDIHLKLNTPTWTAHFMAVI